MVGLSGLRWTRDGDLPERGPVRFLSLPPLAFAAALPPTFLLLASGHFYTPWELAALDSGSVHRRCTGLPPRCARCGSGERAARGRLSVFGATGDGGASLLAQHPSGARHDRSGWAGGRCCSCRSWSRLPSVRVPCRRCCRLGCCYCTAARSLFSLYMVHEIVHQAWNWVLLEYPVIPMLTQKFVVVGLLLTAVGNGGAVVPLRRGTGAALDAQDGRLQGREATGPACGRRGVCERRSTGRCWLNEGRRSRVFRARHWCRSWCW